MLSEKGSLCCVHVGGESEDSSTEGSNVQMFQLCKKKKNWVEIFF